MRIRIIFFIFNFSFLTFHLFAQDLENIKLKGAKPLKINGGFSLSGTAYKPFGMDSRRDPFAYTISANINFKFFELIDAPFAMFISSQNKTFNTPSYNIVGISPKYKWATLHIGSRSMQFTEYTYSGTNFTGAGIELQPQNFWLRGKVFYGCLQKAVPYNIDTASSYMKEPVYERFGGGGMLEIGTQNNNVGITFFRAADKEKSINLPDSTDVKPQENMVIGLSTKQVIKNFLTLSFEYAFSAYTRDMRMEEVVFNDYSYANNFKFLFKPRISSSYSNAYDLKLDYTHSKFSLGMTYKRVDPEYQTMGALYMTNDVENIQLSGSTSFLQNKISLSVSGGLERNNLQKQLEANERRLISNITLSYNIMENLNFSGNFSNFNSSTTPSQMVVFDSIKFVQVTNNASATIAYGLKLGEQKHTFTLSLMQQGVNTINNEFSGLESTNNKVNSESLNYQTTFAPILLSLSAGISHNMQHMQNGVNNSISPTISLSRPFFKKKVRASLAWTESISKNPDKSSANVNMLRFNVSGKIFKKHNLGMNASYMNRDTKSASAEIKKSGEFTTVLTYSYSF